MAQRVLLGFVSLFAVLAAACGGSGGTASEEPAATEEAAARTEEAAAGTEEAAGEEFVFGMILVGPREDHGYSQAHHEGGLYVEEHLPGAQMIVVDSVNPADNPELTVESVVDDMIAQGAQLVFATSDDMKDGILAAAAANPQVPMIWASGDSAWADGEAYEADLTNLGNIFGQMEIGKAIAGCAAALSSETGHLAYLGPLVNDETRRLANSAFLGARQCWTEVRGEDAADLQFEITYIGFWFNIPGVTLDPTQVVTGFIDGGADVVLSGIDTTEALVVSGQRADAGDAVSAVPYDYIGACDEAPDVCLGVPYFNWGPSYLETAEAVQSGDFAAEWRWLGPDFADLNNRDTSTVGFVPGPALSADNEAAVMEYAASLSGGPTALFTGPLNFQDGTEFLADGESATEQQVWYMPALLEGMTGVAEAPE